MKTTDSLRDTVRDVLRSALSEIKPDEKLGRAVLQPHLAQALNTAGLVADLEDSGQFLRSGAPVWRGRASRQIEPTAGRRRIDIVVYDSDSRVCALVEVESDLRHAVKDRSATTTDANRYDVLSISTAASGEHFCSYRSLERMAAAAHYNAGGDLASLEAIRSDATADHNPVDLPLFLASGEIFFAQRSLLGPRCKSLGAEILGVPHRARR